MLYFQCQFKELFHGNNMGLGLLINSGTILELISDHLNALVDTKFLNEI
jgi:hypothetical protein